MTYLTRISLFIFSIFFISCQNFQYKSAEQLKLWYDEPAEEWTEALPIGNGRIGGMVFGGTATDRIQFNEETLWTGSPRDYSREGAADYLDDIRQLLFEGKQAEAERLAGREFMGRRSNEDKYDEQLANWLAKVRSEESLKYANPGFDDSAWEKMEVGNVQGWEDVGFPGMDGAVWLRFTVDVSAEWKGKELVLNLGRIRDTDFTYFNGQLVGTEDNKNAHRRYTIPAPLVKPGKNVIAIQVLNFYDKGGMVGFKTGEPMVIYPKDDQFESGISLATPWKYLLQDTNPPDYPQYEASYQPFGDIWLEFERHGNATNYVRQLDIKQAVASARYDIDGVTYHREYFVSEPDQALIMKVSASEKGALNMTARISSPHQQYEVSQADNQTLRLKAQVRNGALYGVSYLKAQNEEGTLTINNDKLIIQDANEVIFQLTAATNYVSYDDVSANPEQIALEELSAISQKDFNQLKSDHIRDYQTYFETFSIDLGEGENDTLPTDERIRQFSASNDPAFLALYVQYGRYLLISSSRPGTRPANLQGIWNEEITPPWGSKYTTNINAEMNYWPAEVLNLSPMHEPLFQMIREVAEQGKETAKDHYGANGWVLHHNTDLWRATAPINHPNHGIWPTGGAWLTTHLWERFLFTQDTTFLKNEAYPLMKGSAQFFVDFLIEDPETGYLISTPSNSPETGGLVSAPTMDHQLIRALFSNCIATADMLDIDREFKAKLEEMLPRIAPNKIGKYGQLQEWLADIDDPENKHRHVSHLWAVFPGNEINLETTELMDAARQSLEFRGDEGTGWSLAWKINLWARFREGNRSWELIKTLLSPAWTERTGRGGSYKNLFDAHPPFQIDGNFGAAAGVAELIVQSQGGRIVLLPALPDALPNGKVEGLKARGGFELDIEWEDGKLKEVKVISEAGQLCRLVYQGKEVEFKTKPGEAYRFDGELVSSDG